MLLFNSVGVCVCGGGGAVEGGEGDGAEERFQFKANHFLLLLTDFEKWAIICRCVHSL